MLRTPVLTAFLPALAVSSLAALQARADGPAPEDAPQEHVVDPIKGECVRAAEDGQADKMAGKLLAARSELITCARDVCPAAVRTSCTRWFSEVNASVPSVVLRVRDEKGNDVPDASIAIDGKAVEYRERSLPISLDPGEHVVEYGRPGSPKARERVLIATGEKERPLAVTLRGPRSGSERSVAWALGGIGAAALGSFAYFGVSGEDDLDRLRAQCAAGSCSASEIDAAHTKLIVADVSLGIGVIAGGVAAWLLLKPQAADESPSPARSGLGVSSTSHGIALNWAGMF